MQSHRLFTGLFRLIYGYFPALLGLLLACAVKGYQAHGQLENYPSLHANDSVALSLRFQQTEAKIREGRLPLEERIVAYHKLLTLSQKSEFKIGALIALKNLRSYYEEIGEKERALLILRQAIPLAAESPKYRRLLAEFYNHLAISMLHGNRLDSSAYYFLESAKLAKAIGDKFSEATSYNNVSSVYRSLSMPHKSIDYLHKALAVSSTLTEEDLPNKQYTEKWYRIGPGKRIPRNKFRILDLQGKVYRNLGESYIYLNNEDSVALGQHYLSKALTIARKYNIPGLEEGALTSMAVYAMGQGEFYKAIQYFDKVLSIASLTGPNFGFQYAKLGECYFHLKDYQKAASYLHKAIEVADQFSVRTELGYYYITLARVYEAMGKFKDASRYYSLHVSMRDSMDQNNYENAVFRLQYQYETAQKDNEILSNRLKISQQQAVIDRNRMLLLSVILAVSLTALSLGLYLRYRRRLQKQSEMQSLEIAAWRASLDGEEKERRRLAKELHDNIGGNLSTLKMWLGNIRDNSSDFGSQEQDYNGALHLLDHTLMEVRNTAHHLMPELLLRLGLAEAIRVYCNDIQQATGIQVNYQYLGYIGALDNNIELLIYRTVQELVQNVVKHAKASYLLVQLTQFDTTLSITVEDNGIGMDSESAIEQNGMGLSSIRYSIEKLNGAFRLHSEKESGTTVEIELNTESNLPEGTLNKHEQ